MTSIPLGIEAQLGHLKSALADAFDSRDRRAQRVVLRDVRDEARRLVRITGGELALARRRR